MATSHHHLCGTDTFHAARAEGGSLLYLTCWLLPVSSRVLFTQAKLMMANANMPQLSLPLPQPQATLATAPKTPCNVARMQCLTKNFAYGKREL